MKYKHMFNCILGFKDSNKISIDNIHRSSIFQNENEYIFYPRVYPEILIINNIKNIPDIYILNSENDFKSIINDNNNNYDGELHKWNLYMLSINNVIDK